MSIKKKVHILLILSLFMSGIYTPQSFAGEVELLMTPAMVSAIPEHQRVVVDTRSSWKFVLSHIPGAINLGDWQEFTHTVNGVKGLLKEDKSFIADKLGPLGVSSDKTIVIYGEPNDPWRTDGRFFWMFERYGFQRVALLDGGLAGWKQAGKKIQRGRQNSTLQSNLTTKNINLNNQVIADKLLIKKVLLDKNFKIIDNRIRKEFDGTTPYGSPRGGHIPNAIHIHWPNFFKLTETSKHCLPLIPYWIKTESVLTRKSSFIAPVEFGRLWPILFFAIWGLKLGIMTDLGGTGVGPLFL